MFDDDTKCVGLARIGSSTQQIVYGAIRDLRDCDFGKPLHSFVVPGDTHFIERDVLEMYALHREEDEKESKEDDENEIKDNGDEMDNRANTIWTGTDFSGIWTLKESDNLEGYLQSEGWTEGKVTQQIIQNENEMKIKMFSSNGSCSYLLVVGGESVQFTDFYGNSCQITAQWDENRQCVFEHVVKTLKETDTVKKYVIRRALDTIDANRMAVEITNESQHKMTRFYTKL